MRFWLLLIITVFNCAYANENSPVGFWKTLDDKTGQPKAIIQIWQAEDKQLYGRIHKIFLSSTNEEQKLCKACEGDLYNKPITGMIILQNLKHQNPNEPLWSDGKILDPSNGKTYNCNIQLVENDKKLIVRGFIGMPLFGRTQTWLKVGSQQV